MADTFSAAVPYVVYFSDPDEYDFAIAISGGSTQLWTNPANAAAIFGIAWPPPTAIGTKGIYAGTEEFPLTEPGGEISNPEPSGLFMSPSVDSVEAPSQIPNPDPQIPNDSKATVFYWSGFIARGGNPVEDDSDLLVIPQRQFIGGFEYFDQAEGETNGIKSLRDASRTCEGFGGALRNDVNKQWIRQVAKYRTITSLPCFERVYIRIRKTGSVKIDIWKCNGSPSINAGTRLYVDTDLTVKVYNVNAAGAETLRATSFPLVLDSWYQFQIVGTYNDSVVFNVGHFFLRLIGLDVPGRNSIVCEYDVTTVQGGMGQASSSHFSSTLGTVLAGAGNGWEIDLDDWICSDFPLSGETGDPNVAPNALDFLIGSHVKSVRAIDIGPTETGWTGELDYANQMLNPTGVAATSQLTSIIPLATIDLITDANDGGLDDPTGVSFGAVAAIISVYGQRLVGTNDGKLGYSVAGDSPVLTSITESTSLIYNTVAYLPSGNKIPQSIVPFNVVYEKGNSTDTARVNALSAIVEYIGIWGPEDDPQGVMEFKPVNYHNCHYLNITQSNTTPISMAACASIGGTYVGNGTTNVIQLPLAAHWIMIRPLTGGSGGCLWMATGVGGHLQGQEGVLPPHLVRVFQEAGITYLVVTSALANINALGVMYQVVAFCDPTMRYNLCASLMHDGSVIATADYPLILDDFEPEAAFFQFEVQGTSANVKLIYKGTGHTGTTGTQVNGVDKANVASFAAGVLTTLADVHRQSIQTTFSLWRHDDCSGFAKVQITSYTGDASATRVITLPSVTGCYPMYVLVQGHGVKGWFRDPSHTGAHSQDILTGVDSIIAIKAGGVDSITVGTDCNANGTIYEVFVIMGDTAGWNNGIFYAPTIPCDWYVPPPVDPPGDINIFPEGGLIIGGNPPIIALRDISGIYTLVKDRTHDTLYDRQTGQTSVDVKIPDPNFKTGYIGG